MIDLVKGVNKRIVEINNTQNNYFEKAILFVRSEKADSPQKELSDEAYSYLNSLYAQKKKTIKLSQLIIGIVCVLCACAILASILLAL